MSDFKFEPLSNYVVIDVVPRGGKKIIAPETVKVPIDMSDCIVVAISIEKEKDGTPMIRNVKVGDKVILSPTVIHTGATFMLSKKEYVCVRETEILGILTGEPEEAEVNILTLNPNKNIN